MTQKNPKRKLIVIANILSACPGIILINLAPFTLLLIDGEGEIPGYFHEHLLTVLMFSYPLALATCLFLSVRWYKQGRYRGALNVAWLPFYIAVAIVVTYIFGGITLR